MKQLTKILFLSLLLILTTMFVPPEKSYATGEFTVAPQTLNYDALSSGGALTFEFQVSPTYYDNVFYWVVTPSTVTLTAAEVQVESTGSTYPGGSLGYTTTLQQVIEENIPTGGTYNLHYVISNYGSLLPASLGVMTFDAMSFANDTPAYNSQATGDLSLSLSVNTPGTLYGAVYLAGAQPTKGDILDTQGTALAYSQLTFATANEIKTMNFSGNNLVPNQNYVVYLVRQDSSSNYYFSGIPALAPMQLPTTSLLSAVYDNGLLSSLTDDFIRLTFNDPLITPGTASDFIIEVGQGTGQQFVSYDFLLVNGTDYTFGNYDPTSQTIRLNMTEAGVNKIKALPLNTSSVMQIKPAFQNTLRPRVLDTNTVDIAPFDSTVIDRADTTSLSTAVYDDAGTTTTNDDGVFLTFDGPVITNPGSSSDYQIAIDTHSTSGFSTADITLTANDYTVTTPNNGVKLSFTSTGLAKLPNAGLSYWQITIVNPNNLTPQIHTDGRIATFSKINSPVGIAQLSQILVGGVPLTGFEANTYAYLNVGIPYSYVATLNGDYSSLISGISSMGQTIQSVHDPITGAEKITVTAPNMESRTYTINTSINPMSLSNILIGAQPLTGFNKFLYAFSMQAPLSATAPPTLTATADNPSAVVSVSGSGTFPTQYIYAITVTYNGYNKVYTVALYGDPHSSGGTTGSGDRPNSNETSLPPTTPVINIPQGITDVLNTTLNLQDDRTLFTSLMQLDDLVGTMAQSMQTSNMPNEVLKDVIKTSQVVEQKIQNLSNPQDALTVVEQYLSQLSKVKGTLDASNSALEKSASDMLQKISDKASTVTVAVPTDQKTVKIDAASVDQALSNQIAFMEKINAISNQYFGEEIVNKVSTKIVLDIQKPETVNQLATTISPEIIQKLDANGVEKIKVQMGSAGMTFNNDALSKQSDLTVDMKFLDSPNTSATYENNQKSVEFNVYEGQTLVENYEKPIELSFKYEAFGVQPTDNSDLSIFRYNENLKDWDPVGGIIDPQSGEIRVKRTHLSQYTVMKSKKSFSDADNSWAKNEINSLLNKGIVKSTTKFEPKSYLTRGEFSSWIANAFGLQSQGKALPFKDVDKKSEHYAAIASVYNQGLISGKSKSQFDPNGYITEQEMAVIMGQALISFGDKKSNNKTTSKHLASLKAKDVSGWAEQDMALLMELGIKNGKDLAQGNSFVTKETAAAAFFNLYN